MCFFFEDEAVFQQSGTFTRTWAEINKGTVVNSEPVRRSMKTFGAVSLEHKPKWHFRFVERFNAVTFLSFLKQIVRQYPGRKVLMVLDNVRYHHAKLVAEWVAANADRIELHFLPAYSPDFNPIEQIWRVTKRSATHNRHFPTLDALHQTLSRKFNRFQGNPSSLRGAIGDHLAMLRTA